MYMPGRRALTGGMVGARRARAAAWYTSSFTLARHFLFCWASRACWGEYRGVRYTLDRAQQRGDTAVVSTVVERPNNPPTNVDWIISNPGH